MNYLSATEIVKGVQGGRLDPVELVHEALDNYFEREPQLNAFRIVFKEQALLDAEALAKRSDLSELPLAGVPIAIKDSVAYKGQALLIGSAATDTEPKEADHEVVARLKAAGAIVIGLTNVPELCVFGTTDSDASGVTRNPWDPKYTSGGSSGGSAAAVAGGIVPVAHGSDGMGSVRIPAAVCGLFGMKPSSGFVPQEHSEWLGMSENGPLTCTVDDAALLLSVMAEQPGLAELQIPEMPLRIAYSLKPPTFLAKLDKEYRDSVLEVVKLLKKAGHRVEEKEFPYRNNTIALLGRWSYGVAVAAEGLESGKLERRVRRHARLGRFLNKLGLIKDKQKDLQTEAATKFFKEYDLLITPTLTRIPPLAERWARRGWLENLISNLKYASYPSIWNFLGWPAAAVPGGMHSKVDLPLSVQLVAPPGEEKLILQVAKLIEQEKPWPLTAI